VGSLGGAGDGEDCCSEHGQGGPPVPGGPAVDLVLVQPGVLLGGLEVLLSGLAAPDDFDQGGEGDVARCVGAVERRFAGALASDKQLLQGRPDSSSSTNAGHCA
jgi:hypothetical protein